MPDLFGETRVVNIKHEPCDVYIGRPSIYGNPHPVLRPCPLCSTDGDVIHQRGEAVYYYDIYFAARVESDPEFRAAVLDLRGKLLGCHCKNKNGSGPACHGDTIKRWLDANPS